MAHDELDIARRFKAEIRALVKRYPGLVSEKAQTRLNDYICTQTEMENTPMPAKGQRTFQEDLILATVRLPKSDMDAVDRHTLTLQRQHRFTGWSRSDALRDLIQRGLDSLEKPSLSTEKLTILKDLQKEQGGHIERMHDLIEAIPEQTSPVESFPREAELDARDNELKATIKEEIHKNEVQSVEPDASIQATAAVLPTETKPSPAKARRRPRPRKGSAK